MGIVVQFRGGGGIVVVAVVVVEHTFGSRMRLGLGRLQGGAGAAAGGCNFACLPEQIVGVGVGVAFAVEAAYMENHNIVASGFESLDQGQ